MSSRVGTLVAAAVLALGISPAASAQTGAVLSGVVYDRAGTPVPGVVLTVVGPPNGDPRPIGAQVRVVVTDEQGAYLVDRLSYGREYAVHAQHPRFRKSRVQASANEGEAPLHITLAPPRSRLATVALMPLRVLSFGLIGRSQDGGPSPAPPSRMTWVTLARSRGF